MVAEPWASTDAVVPMQQLLATLLRGIAILQDPDQGDDPPRRATASRAEVASSRRRNAT